MNALPAAGEVVVASRWNWRRWWKWAIGLAVAAALAWQVRTAFRDLQSRPQPMTPDFGWLAAATALHALGIAALSGPWLLAGPALGVRASRRSWAAYVASHLGKYVPGKALVPGMRCLLLRDTPISCTIAATFYETACTMAAAALVAGVALTAWHRGLPGPVFLAVALAAASFVVATLPPVFHWLLSGARARAGAAKPAYWRRVPWSRWAAALLAGAAAWVVLSTSFWCAVRATAANADPAAAFRAALLAAPLGTVGGFVSMLPGHFGSREWIHTAALEPVIGAWPALAAAAWHRLATLVAEGLLGGWLWWRLRRNLGERTA